MKQAGKCALCWIWVQLHAVEKVQAQRAVGSWEVVMVLHNVAKAGSLGKCCPSRDLRETGSSGHVWESPAGRRNFRCRHPGTGVPRACLKKSKQVQLEGECKGKSTRMRSQGVLGGGEIMRDPTHRVLAACATWRNTPVLPAARG